MKRSARRCRGSGRVLLLWSATIAMSLPIARGVLAEDAAAIQPDLDPKSLKPIERLEDRFPRNRESAAAELGRAGISSREVHAALLHAIEDGDRNVRVAAARSLHALWPGFDKPVEAVFREAIKNGAYPAQVSAIEAIKDFPTEENAYALNGARSDGDASIRQFARDALVSIGPVGRRLLEHPAKPVEVANNLEEAPPAPVHSDFELLVSKMRSSLRDKDPVVRRATLTYVANATALYGPLVRDLRVATIDADAEVRASAMTILLDHQYDPDASMLPALRGLLAAIDPTLRVNAVLAIGTLHDGATVSDLVGALRDDDRRVRLAAVQTLGRMGAAAQPAVEKLSAILKQKEELDLSRAAAAALIHLPQGEAAVAADAIPSLSAADLRVRVNALDELASVRTDLLRPAIPGLIALLKGQPNEVRLPAVRLLGLFGPDALEAVKPITALVDNALPELRQAAANALIQIDDGGHHLAPALLAAVLHNDRSVSDDLLAAISFKEGLDGVIVRLDELSRSDPNAGVRARAADVSRVWAARFSRSATP